MLLQRPQILLAINLAVLAMPSTQILPRGLEFHNGAPLDLHHAKSCTEDQKKVIRTMLEDAIEIVNSGKDIKISDPAYKAFMDGSITAGIPLTKEQQETFNTVSKRFGLAHDYLTNKPGTAPIRIVCGDLALGSANGCNQANMPAASFNYGASPDIPKPTIIICPSLHSQKEQDLVRLNTQAVDDQTPNRQLVNICQNPERLGLADFPGRILLHEMMHLHQIAPWKTRKAGADGKTRRVRTDVIDCVYGAYLSVYVAQHSSQAALTNADNYAWMAMSKWFNDNCGDAQSQQTFFQKEPIPGKHLPQEQTMGGNTDYNRCKLPAGVGEAINLKKVEVAASDSGSEDGSSGDSSSEDEKESPQDIMKNFGGWN